VHGELPPAQAQPAPRPLPPVDPEAKELARDVVETLLEASHTPEIYQDLRRALKEIYVPGLRDTLRGNIPGAPEIDPRSAAQLAKVLTFMTYLDKADDEIEPALSENRDAIISDVAEQIARTATPDEVADIRTFLDQPAVRKSGEALRAAAKLVTGFSYEDARSFAEFSAWVHSLDFDLSQAAPNDASGPGVPSKRKVARARSFVADFLQLSHLDEIENDVTRFVRDVYLETAVLPEEKRQELSDEIDQVEFNYNMQKAAVLALAPSVLASALTEEELEPIHRFMLSSACVKAFDLFRNAVRAGTDFTKEDVLAAQKSLADLNDKVRDKKGTDENDRETEAQWDALGKKWLDFFKERLSPETRQGLEQSLKELKLSRPPV
jgi:hypothetical protein